MKRLPNWVRHRILGLDDTPHRIAMGVFLGSVVAFTPTLGFQLVLYFILATLLRANKVSGAPLLFISNPVTAVPLYYTVWRVGHAIRYWGKLPAKDVEQDVIARITAAQAHSETSLQGLFEPEFWRAIGRILLELGDELWIGAFALGFAFGIPLYLVTIRAVHVFRFAMEWRASRVPPAPK